MAEQFSEMITGDKAIIDTLRSLIDSRVVCNMKIPRSKQSWITLLLEVRKTGEEYRLLIDRWRGLKPPC